VQSLNGLGGLKSEQQFNYCEQAIFNILLPVRANECSVKIFDKK